jgi:hypothetical protein
MFGTMLDRLRPKNDTAEAIAAALAATEAALEEQRGRAGDLEARRGAALLEGGETARRHEAALREAKDEMDRLAAMAQALRARYAEAERRERRARLEHLADEARRKAERAGMAIKREYPKLAGRLAELLQAEHAALTAIVVAEREIGEAGEDAAGIAPIPRPADFYATPNGLGVREHLSQRLTLPRAEGVFCANPLPPYWRAEDHRLVAGAPVI